MGDGQPPAKRQKLDEPWVYNSLGDLDFMQLDDGLRHKVASTFCGKDAAHLSSASAADLELFLKVVVADGAKRLETAMCLQHHIKKLQSPAPVPRPLPQGAQLITLLIGFRGWLFGCSVVVYSP